MTSREQENIPSAVVLVPGHWLGAWAWQEVAEELTAAGLRAIPVTPVGLAPDDPHRASRTLWDQVEAIESLVEAEAEAGDVVLVAHSGANAPVTAVIDRHPELIRRVVWVDSGPVMAGSVYAPDLPGSVTEVPLPAFDVLGAQASLEGLSAAHLDRFRERAVPEPAAVMRAAVELGNEARAHVPTMMVCCSISARQVREMAQAGHPMFAEVAKLGDVEFIDLPTGHWPMWSRPGELAGLIARAALRRA